MRDVAYIDAFMRRFKKIWKKFPNMRFGQFIANCLNYQQIYYLSDEDIIKIIEDSYNKILQNTGGDKK